MLSNLNLERLVGVPAEQIIKLPKADADAKEWDAVHAKLGRPATPDEYKLEVPTGADDTYAKHIAKVMHENGLSAKQAQAVAKGQAEFVATEITRQAEADATAQAAEKVALTKEWGAAYDKNLQVARAAAKTFGLTTEVIDSLEDAMGLKATMTLLHTLGSRLGEDAFEGGSGHLSSALSPAEAKARITGLKNDAGFRQKLINGDVTAKKEMHDLHVFAYGE